MESAFVIIILAIFGETIIEVLKPILAPLQEAISARVQRVDKDLFYLYLSTALGLFLAFTFTINVLAAVGIEMPNQAAMLTGIIGTGLAIGRGSNFVHNFINRLANPPVPEVAIEASADHMVIE